MEWLRCAQPTLNSFCTALSRIRETKTVDEDKLTGRGFDTLSPAELPPCKAESAFFMSPHSWVREFDHPYRQNKNCAETHGNMQKRLLGVPPFSAIAVPFNWMLRRNQKHIEQGCIRELPIDAAPPFPSPWVFGRQRQEAIVDLVFGQLTAEKSLALFYTKEGHPLGDGIRRLVVGLGRITKVGQREHYDTVDGKQGYPERFAQQALGHNSKAVHHAYSKNAEVTVPSLDDWEKQWKGQSEKIEMPKLVAVNFRRQAGGTQEVGELAAAGVSEAVAEPLADRRKRA